MDDICGRECWKELWCWLESWEVVAEGCGRGEEMVVARARGW